MHVMDWINSHGVELVIAMFIYSNVVGALPTPKNGNLFYKFLYDFLHLTAANAPKVFPSLRILGDQDKPVP